MSRDRDTWREMPDQPRECAGCKKPVRMTKDTIWFDSHARKTWHFSCRPSRLRIEVVL